MDYERFASPNWLSTTLSASSRSRKPPTNFIDEATFYVYCRGDLPVLPTDEIAYVVRWPQAICRCLSSQRERRRTGSGCRPGGLSGQSIGSKLIRVLVKHRAV